MITVIFVYSGEYFRDGWWMGQTLQTNIAQR